MILDERFFKKYQRWILKFANSKIGKFYLCSGWSKSEWRYRINWLKIDRFVDIFPSGTTVSREYFYTCRRCLKNENPDIQRACPHKRKILAERNITLFFTGNHFAQKFSLLLFWMPYWKAFSHPQFEAILKPRYAFPLFILLNFLSLKAFGVPFFFSTISTFNSATGAADPFDGRVRLDAVGSTWNTERTKSAGDGGDETAVAELCETGKDASGNFQFKRMVFIFSTGATIDATATINATTDTTLKVTRNATAVNNGDSGAVSLVQSKIPSNSGIAGTNFGVASGPPFPVATGAMTEGATRKAVSGLATSTQYNWDLDANGRPWVARSGETKPTGAVSADRTRLGFAEGKDATDVAYAGANSTLNNATFFMKDNGTNIPVLSVDWSTAAGGAPNMSMMGVGG